MVKRGLNPFELTGLCLAAACVWCISCLEESGVLVSVVTMIAGRVIGGLQRMGQQLVGAALLACLLLSTQAHAQAQPAAADVPLVRIGKGDEMKFEVYGQQDMNTVLLVSDDGKVTIPLAGAVEVEGLSPAEAAMRLEKALRDGQYLVNPHVTLTVVQSRSQRISVLGEVRTPGRYPVDSSTSIFDLLALAGGVTPNGASTVYLLRPDSKGGVSRYPVNLRGLDNERFKLPVDVLQAGDSIYVPRADQFYIFGEIAKPGMYSIEPDMTLLQAIAKAGGVTPRGSMSRIEIKRRVEGKKDKTFSANVSEQIKPDDVIEIKESFF